MSLIMRWTENLIQIENTYMTCTAYAGGHKPDVLDCFPAVASSPTSIAEAIW